MSLQFPSLEDIFGSIIKTISNIIWNAISNVVNTIWNAVTSAISSVASTIWNAINWVWSQVSGFLGKIWEHLVNFYNWVVSNVTKLANQLSQGLQWLWNTISNAVRNFVNWLWQGIQTVGNWIWSGLQKIWNFIVGGIQELVKRIMNFFGWVSQGFKQIFNWIMHGANWIVNQVVAGIDRFAKWLVNEFSGLWMLIQQHFVNPILNFINMFVDSAKMFISNLPKYMQMFMQWFVTAIVYLINFARPIFAPIVQGFVSEIASQLSSAMRIGTPPKHIYEPIKEAVETIQGTYVKKIEELIHSPPAIHESFSKALEIAAAALGAAGMVLAIANAVDWIHPMKETKVTDVARKLLDAFAITAVASTIMSAPVMMGLMPMVKYDMQSRFRPEIPSVGDLMQFRGHNFIDFETFRACMAMHGIPDEWIKIYDKLAITVPGVGYLLEAYARGYVDEGFLTTWLKWYGYSDEFINMFKQVAYRRVSPYYIVWAFTDYLPKKEDLIKIIQDYGIRPEYAELIARGMIARLQRAGRGRVIGLVFDLVELGVWDTTKAMEVLRSLGLPEYLLANYQLALQLTEVYREAREQMRWKRRENRAYVSRIVTQLVNLYKEGFIDDERLLQELTELGLTEVEIRRIMKYAQLRFEYDLKMDIIRELKYLYTYGYIDDAELEQELSRLGLPAEKIVTYMTWWRVIRERRLRRRAAS